MKKAFKYILFLILITSLHPHGLYPKDNDANDKLVNKVFNTLIRYVEPVRNFDWPPKVCILEDTIIKASSKVYYNQKSDKGNVHIFV